MRFPSFRNSKTRHLRDKLFSYMLVMTIVILIVLGLSMLMFGEFPTTEDTTVASLNLQMEVFNREIVAHQEELAMRSTGLSESLTRAIEAYLHNNNLTFDTLNNSPEHLNNLHSHFLGTVSDALLQSDSSGAFVLLDATVNTSLDHASLSKSGIYLQKMFPSLADSTLLLLRGNAKLGKENGFMPHRKWELEFNAADFPSYDALKQTSSDTPLDKAYRITEAVMIPGTSERVMLVAVPLIGYNGDIYGICGFEIAETTFKISHAQPTMLERMICLFSPAGESIDMSKTFCCGTEDGYFLPPSGILHTGQEGELCIFENADNKYIGVTKELNVQEDNSFMLSLMIPYKDYKDAVVSSTSRIVVLIILLAVFAVSCCYFFSKQFIAPIMKGLEQIHHSEHGFAYSGIHEIDDLFAFLAEKDKDYEVTIDALNSEKEEMQEKMEKVQAEIDRLSYSRKKEIDPDDYENFLIGIKSLTKTERNIFEMYLAGKTAQEITETIGIKESTLKFHNHNIYEKLGVSSRKQMLRFAAIYSSSEGGNI